MGTNADDISWVRTKLRELHQIRCQLLHGLFFLCNTLTSILQGCVTGFGLDRSSMTCHSCQANTMSPDGLACVSCPTGTWSQASSKNCTGRLYPRNLTLCCSLLGTLRAV